MEKRIYREDLLQMLNVKEQTLKEIIKKKKLAERLERLGFTYLRTEKEGRKSVYIIEEKSNSENILMWNSMLVNYFGIKPSNGDKFARYLLYRFSNINNPITKQMIAEKVGVSRVTISKWDEKLIELDLMKKLETYYIERIGTEETDARDIIINIVSEKEKNEYWSNKTKVDKTVNSKLYLFAKKNEKDRKLEDSKEEAKALESIEQYMKTGEYIRMLNDVRGRFVFSVDKYGLTGEDGTANPILRDLLKLSRKVYDLNGFDFIVEWKELKELFK